MSEDLSRDAARLSELYRQIPLQEPPAHLDAAILQAVEANTAQASPQRSLRRWALPASMAALLVLGVGVVRLTIQEMPQAIPQATSPTPSAARPEQSLNTGKIEQKARTLNELPSPADVRSRVAEPILQEDADESLSIQPFFDLAAPPTRPALSFDEQEKKPVIRESIRQQQHKTRAADKWLEDIAELSQQGRDAEAQASWAAFRQSYPDYPVDEALQQQFK